MKLNNKKSISELFHKNGEKNRDFYNGIYNNISTL